MTDKTDQWIAWLTSVCVISILWASVAWVLSGCSTDLRYQTSTKDHVQEYEEDMAGCLPLLYDPYLEECGDEVLEECNIEETPEWAGVHHDMMEQGFSLSQCSDYMLVYTKESGTTFWVQRFTRSDGGTDLRSDNRERSKS